MHIDCDKIKESFESLFKDVRRSAYRYGAYVTKNSLFSYPPISNEKYTLNEIEEKMDEKSLDIRNDVAEDFFKYNDEFLELEGMLKKYGKTCDLPSDEEVLNGIHDDMFLGIESVVYKYMLINTDSFDYSSRTRKSGDVLKEIPKELLDAMKLKEEVMDKTGKDLTPSLIDISNNDISNMCDLQKLRARKIYINNNPIKEIYFANGKQFLNVVRLNNFDNTNLPDRIKKEIKECQEQIETLLYLSDNNEEFGDLKDPSYLSNLTDDVAEKFLLYAEACEDAYYDIQSSMC